MNLISLWDGMKIIYYHKIKKNETDGDIVDLHNAFLKLNETGRKKNPRIYL